MQLRAIPSSHSANKQGFTLIELLVVIAIIAILAAILFPVFAAAREKARQTTCASNLKQDALAILQYEEDYDEVLPQGEVNLGGATGWSANPATGAVYFFGTPGGGPHSDSFWSNSIQPYIKSYLTYYCPDTPQENVFAEPTPVSPWITYTYNGDLTSLNESRIVEPSGIILLWSGIEKNSAGENAFANPAPYCPNAGQPCVIQPYNANCQASTANGATDFMYAFNGFSSYSKWVHGNGDNFAFCDGHVKWTALEGDPNHDPWVNTGSSGSILDSTGNYSWTWNGCDAWLFAPDDPV